MQGWKSVGLDYIPAVSLSLIK